MQAIVGYLSFAIALLKSYISKLGPIVSCASNYPSIAAAFSSVFCWRFVLLPEVLVQTALEFMPLPVFPAASVRKLCLEVKSHGISTHE